MPAPALATHKRESGKLYSCISALLTIIPSGFTISPDTVKFSPGSLSRPFGEIALSVSILYIILLSPLLIIYFQAQICP